MASRPEKIIADHIRNNAGLSQDVIAGPYHKRAADDAISCTVAGGPPPTYLHNGGSPTIKEPSVQIVIRGAPNDYAGTITRANTVWDTVSGANPTGADATWVDQSAPFSLGADGQGRHRYSINVRVLLEE